MKKVNGKNAECLKKPFSEQGEDPPPQQASCCIGNEVVYVAVAHGNEVLLHDLGEGAQGEGNHKGIEDRVLPENLDAFLKGEPARLQHEVDAEDKDVDQLVGLKEVEKGGQRGKYPPGQDGEQYDKRAPQDAPEVIFQEIFQQSQFEP